MKRPALQNNLLLSAIFFLCSASLSAQNSSPEEPSEAALASINKAIAEVQQEIASRNSERTSTYQTLEKTEKELSALRSQITAIETSISENQAELSQHQTDREQLLATKLSQQELISQYLRTAYQTGRQEYFKLLLNQENPALVSRTLRYYQYFNEARSQKVEQYTATINKIIIVEGRITESTAALNNNRELLDTQQNAMQASLNNRQNQLDELDILLTSSSRKLEALEAERSEMELLIEELRRSISNLSLGDQQQPFANMKGQLPWPVAGVFKNRWGSSYGLGDLNWEGVTINAASEADIIAIHRGRVVYADWFSSSGLLLIIDHGDGYMSLYAHNQELYRDVGEWVNGGDIIASVGNTGGQQDFGLYFEIRHNGESENPASWCLAGN